MKVTRIDLTLAVTVLLLCLVGLAMVWSASSLIALDRFGTPNAYFTRQLMWTGLGFALCMVLANFPYVFWREPALLWGLVLTAIGGLAAVFAFPARGGAHRWIKLPGLSGQPSDLAKVALIILVADQLAAAPPGRAGAGLLPARGEGWRLARLYLTCALVLGLILKEPDLGTTVVLGGTLFLIFFIAGLPWRHIVAGGALCAAALALLIIASPYRMRRMTAFLHPEATHQGEGYQIEQAKLALGAGGLTGKWIMNGRQQMLYLPEAHNDCIFASLGEEMGLIGTTLVLLGFGLVIWRGYKIALQAPNPFGQYLAFGLTSLIALQTLFNLFVVTGLAPPKGIALPFFSAGGSSMVISLAAVGILLNISQHGRRA